MDGKILNSLNFNKSLSELNIEEIAFMAALPKAPNNYHPIDNYENAITRRNWVLELMYSNGYIAKNDLLLKNKKLIVKNRDTIDLIFISIIFKLLDNSDLVNFP